MSELIIDGARPGKSTLAEQRARDSGAPVIYVATARLEDGDMGERVAHHRARRSARSTGFEVAVADEALPSRLSAVGLWSAPRVSRGAPDHVRRRSEIVVGDVERCLGELLQRCR